MKRFSLCLLAFLALFLGAALAEGECPLSCGRCRDERDCRCCVYCAPVFQTARPAAVSTPACAATVKPACTSVSAPACAATVKPACTSVSAPACAATVKPAGTVQPAATAKPTPAPQVSRPNVPDSSPSTGDYTTISVTAQEQKMVNLLNQDRARNGLSALPLDSELSAIARAKSCEMMEKGYFDHESPTWGRAPSMLTAFGYAYNGVGENIAHHATVEKAEAAFLSSSPHRINMMGSQWKKVGIGVCTDQNGYVYVTELFVR